MAALVYDLKLMTPTIASALATARAHLSPVSDSASGDAQVLLCHVLAAERAYLFAHPEQPLAPDQAAAFDALVTRCAAGEPLPYVLGRRAWYDRDFIVTPAVLIPRPETELLLEQAVDWTARRDLSAMDATSGVHKRGSAVTPIMPSTHHPIAIDVGTGSGILAVTFAAMRAGWQVWAFDISSEALAVARQNAALHGVEERIRFEESDLLSTWAHASPIDLLMANLPYIPSADVAALRVAQHEPHLALDGGDDGLHLIRRLLAQAQPTISRNGLILLEIEARQGAAASAEAAAAFPMAQVAVLRDYAGLDRIVRIALTGR